MKSSATSIAVIGGGITGVTTAYALAKRGFTVTLFEKNRYAAMETSFANGGQLSASNAEVWNHWSTILKGEIWQSETVNRRKDGTLFTEFQTITPVRDTRGEISHFISIEENITERIRVQETLRLSEERFALANQATPTGIAPDA